MRTPSPSSARTICAMSPSLAASCTATLPGPKPVVGVPNRSSTAARRAALLRFGRYGLDGGSRDLRLELLWRALGDDVPVVDDPDAVREDVRLLQVLRRQEDGDAFLLRKPADLLPQGRPALDVEPGRRLVEKEDARAVDERQRQVEAPLHPARVAADLAVGGLGETDSRE